MSSKNIVALEVILALMWSQNNGKQQSVSTMSLGHFPVIRCPTVAQQTELNHKKRRINTHADSQPADKWFFDAAVGWTHDNSWVECDSPEVCLRKSRIHNMHLFLPLVRPNKKIALVAQQQIIACACANDSVSLAVLGSSCASPPSEEYPSFPSLLQPSHSSFSSFHSVQLLPIFPLHISVNIPFFPLVIFFTVLP
jgi:hypothetical protein